MDVAKCDLEESRWQQHIPTIKYTGNLEDLKRLLEVRQCYEDDTSSTLTSFFEIVKVVNNIILLMKTPEIFVDPRDDDRLF